MSDAEHTPVSVVTGANAGIGKAITGALASRGHHVVMVCRSPERGEAALAELRSASDSPIDLVIADLSLQSEVRRLAAELLTKYGVIQLLVNNAGAIFNERQLTADGVERTWALNHLGYFLLANLLLERLMANSSARIVNVASNASRGARMDLDNLQGERSYVPFGAYARSKLANIMFTRSLASRIGERSVTVNCLHPGTIQSRITDRQPAPVRWYFRAFGTTPDAGADTAVWLATSPEVEGRSGGYYVKRKERRVPRLAKDELLLQQLWEDSERLTASSVGPAR